MAQPDRRHDGKFARLLHAPCRRGWESDSERSALKDHTIVSAESPPGHATPVRTGEAGTETGFLQGNWERTGRYRKLPAVEDEERTDRKRLPGPNHVARTSST